MPPRRGRPPAAEPKLDTEAIVTAGLETLQAEGLDGLTMTKVAERLGVRAASLYWHVRNKEELVDLLADALSARHNVAQYAVAGDWRGSITAMMRAMREHALTYRDSGRLLAGRFSTSGGQLRNIEAILGTLRGSGLSDHDASYALFMLSSLTLGFISGAQSPLSASVASGQTARSYLDTLKEELSALPEDEFPNTTALAGDLTEPDLASRFDFALKCVLDGIAALPRLRDVEQAHEAGGEDQVTG